MFNFLHNMTQHILLGRLNIQQQVLKQTKLVIAT